MPTKVNHHGAFIKGVVVKKFRTSDGLIDAIHEKHGLQKAEIKRLLRYNVLTIENLCKVTGLKPQDIHARIRGHIRRGNIHYSLNTCDPFDSLYLKFVYRNDKCQKLIEKKAGYEPKHESTAGKEEELTE